MVKMCSPNQQQYPALTFVIAALLTTMLISTGCGESPPPDLIEEETYINILAEIHLLAAIHDHFENEQKYTETQEAILEHYDISRDQFERSHDYYHRDMDAQLQRLREARNLLEGLSQEYIYQQYDVPQPDETSIDTRPDGAPVDTLRNMDRSPPESIARPDE